MIRRSIQHQEPLQVRADEGKPVVISGYGAVFYVAGDSGTEYRREMGDGWALVERIMPGAFDAALAREGDIVALWSHESGKPLGRRSKGTLTLKVDTRGLAYEIEPPQTSWGIDAVSSIKRGDVQASSFGFDIADGWTEKVDRENKIIIQEITAVSRLFEVSPCAIPAYTGTAAESRAIDADTERLRALIARDDTKHTNNFQTEKARAMVACALASLD